MSDVYGIALSGLNAAGAQLNVTANNLANLDTPGYNSERVDLAELSTGGVGVAGVSTDPTPGPIDANGKEGSNVDPAQQVVDLHKAKLLYSANAAVVKTQDQMLGTLLSMFDTDRKNAKVNG